MLRSQDAACYFLLLMVYPGDTHPATGNRATCKTSKEDIRHYTSVSCACAISYLEYTRNRHAQLERADSSVLHMPSLTYHASKPVSQREYHAHFSEKEVKSERERRSYSWKTTRMLNRRVCLWL